MAKDKAIMAGSVIDIDGPRAMFSRNFSTGAKGAFQAYIGLPVFYHDVFQTDEKTEIVIQFMMGGRAKIGRGERIYVATLESVEHATMPGCDLYMEDLRRFDSFESWMSSRSFKINTNSFWEKFNKQDKEFQIQTAGGTLGGIEG